MFADVVSRFSSQFLDFNYPFRRDQPDEASSLTFALCPRRATTEGALFVSPTKIRWTGRNVRVVGSVLVSLFTPSLNFGHLLGVLVVVRERPVNVSHVDIVSVRHRLWFEPTSLDLLVKEEGAQSPAIDPRFTAEDVRRRDASPDSCVASTLYSGSKVFECPGVGVMCYKDIIGRDFSGRFSNVSVFHPRVVNKARERMQSRS